MNHYLRIAFAVGICMVASCCAATLVAAPDASALMAKYEALSRQYTLANPDWRPTPPRTGSLLFIAPDEYSPEMAADEVSRAAREKYAASLFELASEAAATGQSSLAFQWTTEVLRENPDHAEARRILGYAKRNGKWLTPFGVRMLDAGKVWDSQKGWVAADGSAPAVPESRVDAARHTDIKNGWQVRTDHFFVTTNHSQAAGVELASRLEGLYQIWRQIFAGFNYSDKEVKGLFTGERIARVPVRQFRVLYHRNRSDYVNSLSRREPKIDQSLGVYFDSTSEAHFFAAEIADDKSTSKEGKDAKDPKASITAEDTIPTLYHEAVHQLFQESAKPPSRRVGENANSWVIEGVATYFETLTEHDDPKTGLYFTIGERSAGRLPAARKRLQDNYYVPLADLTKLGKYEMQSRDDVIKLYSQSSGLAAFLLDSGGGRHREPMVRYLQAVYTRKDNDQTLAEVTGSSYSELDAAYRRFMESLP